MTVHNEKLVDNIAKALKESGLIRPPMSLGLTPAQLNVQLLAAIAKGLDLDSSTGRRAPARVGL
jgi:hypothetical protein